MQRRLGFLILLAGCTQTRLHRTQTHERILKLPTQTPWDTPFKAVPQEALRLAMEFFNKNKSEFKNQRYISIIDYGQRSNVERFYILDLETNRMQKMLVAHGKGSDEQHTGMCMKVSDEPKSLATSLGFFRTGTIYKGKHGTSLKLIGLSHSNKNAESRAIVVHGAAYVSKNRKILGRSWGCPAVSQKEILPLIAKIKEGSLLFAWHPKLYEE